MISSKRAIGEKEDALDYLDLSEVADVIDSLHKTPRYSDHGIPMVRVTNIRAGFLKTSDTLKVSEEVFEEFTKNHIPKQGDIVLSRVGTYGVSSYVYNDEKFCLGQNTAIIVPKINAKYLYYCLQSPIVRNQVEEMVVGSTQKTISLKNIRALKIPMCDSTHQKEIGEMLFFLDDKIEINSRINKALEEMAQAIFKLWFVDFEFPDENDQPYKSSDGEMEESKLGLIPKGWRVESLDSIAVYLNGLAMQKFRPQGDEYIPVIKIRELNQGKTDIQSDRAKVDIDARYIIDTGDVLFSWSGSLEVKIWCGGKGGLNQHLFKVTSDRFEKWFYYLWTKHHLEKFRSIAQDKATTMGHIQRKHLTESMVLIPDDASLSKLNSLMTPIFKLCINNSVEILQLIVTRDCLLPKLMSGEIRVPIEEAADCV